MIRYDLHLHSDRSDGEHPPDEVLRRCARGGLDVVAITDHDIVPAFEPGLRNVEGRDIRVIAALEASGVHDGAELHFLIYFPGPVPSDFALFSRRQVEARVERYDAAAGKLGLPLADESARSGQRALTRHHLARALIAAGRAKHIHDAFARFVGTGCGNVPPFTVTAGEVIDAARQSGGLVSWAHPGRDQVDRWLAQLVALGLQGVEGIRPSLTSRDRRVYRDAARRHGLFLTGGSDWHGWHDLDPGLFAVERDSIASFADLLAD